MSCRRRYSLYSIRDLVSLESITTPEEAAAAKEEEDRVAAANNVLVEKLQEHHIMSIGINRTDKRNCVNMNTASLLYDAFYDFEQDEDMHVAVLHGVSGNLCAGFDLEELATYEQDLANKIAATMLDRGPMVMF